MLVVRENSELVGVRFLELVGKPTDEEVEVFLEAEERVARAATEDFVLVLSLKEAWSSTQRKWMRDRELELAPTLDVKQLGMAMVVPNPLVRGAFTAYFWIAPPAYPISTVSEAAAAYSFVARCLEAGNLPIPSQAEFERVAQSRWPERDGSSTLRRFAG